MSRLLHALILLVFVSACGSANYSAPRNLDVPPYQFIEDEKIRIG